MSTLEVKPGISLFYLDSGPPGPDASNETYLTLFMLHGHTFHSPVFARAIDAASKHNIRLVAITRRDYHGSSLLTAEDIKASLEGPTEKRLQAFAERAEEILLFIQEFITINNIPQISPSGGGFSLSGWSLGNLQGFSVLGFGNLYPDIARKLEPYFRTYIQYETTVLLPPPSDVYHPLSDESVPREERGRYFCDWISSYFVHTADGIASGDVALLNQRIPSTTKPSSFSQFSPEDHVAILDHKPSFRADIFYYRLDQKVNDGILERAFINQPDSQNSPAWPNVPVRSLWGDETAWSVIFSQRELEKWLKKLQESENIQWVRTYESNCVSGGNHFLHWDEPDKFIEAVKRLML